MPENPNKLSQFWQELKRRRVVRVIAMYAGVAYIIIELISNITGPLHLPDWTTTLVILLLTIGFPITILLSWIFDVTPEGLKKTEPFKVVKEKDAKAKPSKRKLRVSDIIIALLVVIVVILVYPKIFQKNKFENIAEKSIAVRPFWNESTEKENEFFVNGMTEDIRINLSKIADLRVLSRGSVEKYRDTQYSTIDIARDLNVTYVLEGTAQRIENQVKIHVQLILAQNDDHIWENSYKKDIKDATQVFDIQNQIAQSVAKEINAIITPEEKQLIDKVPTTNLTAYDFFRKGREEQEKWWYDFDREALERAEVLFHKALEYDSTYAQAYTGLAYIYQAKQYRETVFTETSLDSMLILADIALSFDDQLSEAYVIRGRYYMAHNKKVEAANEFEKALQFNPNEWLAYYNIGSLNFLDDNVKTIDNYQKAASLHRGDYLPRIYQNLGHTYAMAGFMEKYRFYKEEALKLDDDSAAYYKALAQLEDANGNFEKAIVLGRKSYAMDSTDLDVIILLGIDHMYLDQLEESLEYWKKYIIRFKTLDRPLSLVIFRIGYVYLVNGFKEEADNYFNTGFELYNDMIESGRFALNFVLHYDLAAIYAVLGDKEKAFEHLRLFNRKQVMPFYMIKDIKNDPMYDNLRDEPEFQQIVSDVEAKYQAEHERVGKWLEENDML